MRYRTSIYLLTLAACLASLLWMLEKRDRQEQREPDAPTVVFPAFKPENITRLEIEHDNWAVAIERRDHAWRIVQPFTERADSQIVHRILDALARLPVRELLTRPEWEERGLTPRHFGLDRPAVKLTAAGRDTEFVLLIGVESPLDQGIYVQAGDADRIVLTDRALQGYLPATADDLKERAFSKGIPADVVRMDIKPYGGQYLQLERASDGHWFLLQPFEARTERGVVKQLLDLLFNARVLNFMPPATSALPAAYGLEEGEAVVQITIWKNGAGESGTELFLGHPAATDPQAVYARRADSAGVFTLPRQVRDGFQLTPSDLRDRRIFHIDPWTVTGIEIRDGETDLDLRLMPDGWHVRHPVQWRADDEIALRTAVEICELRASRYMAKPATATPAGLGLDPPRYAVALRRKPDADSDPAGEKPSQTVLLIGYPTADGLEYHAQRKGDPAILTLPAELLEGRLIGTNAAGRAFTDPLVYHDRSVLAIDPATVWRIDLQRGESRQIIERHEDGRWKVVQPEGRRVNPEQLQTILDLTAQLRALRIEHRGIEQPAAFGFDRPGLILTLSLTGANGISKTLITGFRARTDGIFARVQGRDLVFSVGRHVVEQLSHDPTLPPDNTTLP